MVDLSAQSGEERPFLARTAPTGYTGAEGFTLLEVLIALAILALALSALIKAGSASVGNATYLRDKTLAHWVAMNELTRLQVFGEWPAIGDLEDTAEMAGREYDWRIVVAETPVDTMRRLEVEVRPVDREDDEPLTRLVGFVREPRPGSGGIQ